MRHAEQNHAARFRHIGQLKARAGSVLHEEQESVGERRAVNEKSGELVFA